MKNFQKGGVSVGIIILVALFVLFVCIIGSVISARDKAVNFESRIEGRYKDNENILSSCVGTLRTIGKIPGKYTDELNKVLREEMSGRYGTGERVALFIKERDLPFTQDMHNKIMNTVIDCETKFENGQRALTDMKVSYESSLGSTVQGGFMKMAGFPKKDLSKFTNIIQSDAREQFETKVRKDFDIGDGK